MICPKAQHFCHSFLEWILKDKGNNKITQPRTILQRESQNA
jgi:hypothetical protein